MDIKIIMATLFNAPNIRRQVGKDDENPHIKNWQLYKEPLEFYNEKENSILLIKIKTNSNKLN